MDFNWHTKLVGCTHIAFFKSGPQHSLMRQLKLIAPNSARKGPDSRPNRVYSPRGPLCAWWLAVALLAALSAGAVQAQVKFGASYRVTLAGLPIGTVSANAEFDQNGYKATASGETSGLLQIIATGHGEILACGIRSHGEPLSSAYASTIVIRSRSEMVNVSFANRNAGKVSVDPAPAPNGNLLPLTEADRKRVVDPLTAALVGVPDGDQQLGPEVCRRSAPIFDGQLRYNLKLAFIRLADVRTEVGYQGKVVVCSVSFLPIAGHDPNRFLFKYLAEQRDMELWLAPVVGAGILMPYRIAIRTPMGVGVMQADRFVSEPVSTTVTAPK
jgi:hypothetical protein